MKKSRGVTNRITAMLLSGMLVFGLASGAVFAAEADYGEKSADSGEVYSEEEYSEEALTDEAADECYTVTLDANGGYFENEWDDILGDYVEQALIIDKQIHVGGTVASFPIFTETDPDGKKNQTMRFAGWSLESDGEPITVEDEEYAPVDNCTLYAVWQALESDADMQEDASEEDGESQKLGDESADLADTAQEVEYLEVDETEAKEESEIGFKDAEDTELTEETESVEETEAEETGEETKAVGESETAQVSEETAIEEVVEDTNLENNNTENNTASDAYKALEEDQGDNQTNNQQETATAQEVIYSNEEEEMISEKSADTSTTKEETNPAQIESLAEEEIVREDAAMDVVSSGTCGESLTWTFDGQGTLTISGTGEMENFYYQNDSNNFEEILNQPWVYFDVKKVVIEYGVTKIGKNAFRSCSNLKDVIIPNSVTWIGEAAFEDTCLSSITLPQGLSYIDYDAFRGCSRLTNVTIPDTVSYLDEGIFRGCTSLANVTIPDSVKSLRGYVFEGCTSLQNIDIPDSITWIDEATFANSAITSIVIPEGVEHICSRVFWECKNLKTVVIPESVETIWENAFLGCTNLTDVVIPEGVKCIKDAVFMNCTGLKNVTIPASVTTIGEGDGHLVFPYGLNGLTIYGYPNTEAQRCAEAHEIRFESISTPYKSIKNADVSISNQVYSGHPLTPIPVVSMEGKQLIADTDYFVSFKDNTDAGTATIKIIGKGHYTGTKTATFQINKASQYITASNLSLTYPNGGKIMVSGNQGTLSFTSSNTAVATVDASGNVTPKGVGTATITITSAATANYNQATKQITVTVTKETQPIIASGTCGDNLTWTLDDSGTLTISGTGEMENYSKIKKGTYSGFTEGVLPPWFDYRDSIECIVVQEGVTSIGTGAFTQAGANDMVEYISLPNSLTTIKDAAFAYTGCPVITFGDHPIDFDYEYLGVFTYAKFDEVIWGYDYMSSGLFMDSRIKKITLAGNIKSIPDDAFRGMTTLSSITIPNSTTSIGNHAFYNCDSLTSINIPDNVKSIGKYAFFVCDSLKNVNIEGGVETIGEHAFESCSALETVDIGQGTKNIESMAFSNCSSLKYLELPAGLNSIGYAAFSGASVAWVGK
ncbi:MAG: leucine-rich repeat protein [Oscillospiraceae bacterium]|nr:leucine-rich repeat protein [Oscillospiraceae bacterium]